MRVCTEVFGRPLFMAGARYNVGERVLMDPDKAQHAEALESGWVRRVPAPDPGTASVAAPEAPPAHKMMESPPARKAQAVRKWR